MQQLTQRKRLNTYGRFLPSVYCGNSNFATPSGDIGGVENSTDDIVYFDVPGKARP